MTPRKLALPNNGSNLKRNFGVTKKFADSSRNANRELASIRARVRPGKRQNGEGFGGGRIMGK